MASIMDIKIGGPAKGPSKRSGKEASATEKELQRLRRIDLLELLLDEIRQNEENSARLKEATDLNDRLNAKLDDQEAQIKYLQQKLADKDAEMERLQANNETMAHGNGYLDVEELLRVQRLAVRDYMARIPEFGIEKCSAHAAPPAVYKPAHGMPSSPEHGASANTQAGE